MHHHRVIHAVLERAKKDGVVLVNAANLVDVPKVAKKEPRYLTDTEAQQFVSLLMAEPDIRKKTALLLLLYSGVRRGELCGLEWEDIDLDKGIVSVNRASRYLPETGLII